jgi:AraC-like DNA-binding protein
MWKPLPLPKGLGKPRPLIVRIESIPARHYFPQHAHKWHQLVYAISGVLTVTTDGNCTVISPEHAVWLPTGQSHRVGSLLGAEFRSLWLDAKVAADVAATCTVFSVSPLLRALIVEAADIQGLPNRDGYADRVAKLIIDQLHRAETLPAALPWPHSAGPVMTLCEALYSDPADTRGPEEWAAALSVSARTLTRRFNDEVGLSLSGWRRRLRMFKAIEMLGGGCSVTQTAFDLGYGSSSAFIFAFRQEMGRSPLAYYRLQQK